MPFVTYAALTHKPRPYCDLKTSKIAFFFRKSLVFFQISLADGPGLCSLVFSTFSLCPQYDPSTSMAFPLRLYCVPKATPRRSSATQLRLCYVLCVLTATLRRLLRLSGDCPATVRRPYYVLATSIKTILFTSKFHSESDLTASLVRVYYVYCVLIASLLRCCCDYGDSTAIPRRPNQDSARTQSFCDCFVHVQNSRRRSATLCVLGFLATTSLRPCCVHGDCAASWVVARSQ